MRPRSPEWLPDYDPDGAARHIGGESMGDRSRVLEGCPIQFLGII